MLMMMFALLVLLMEVFLVALTMDAVNVGCAALAIQQTNNRSFLIGAEVLAHLVMEIMLFRVMVHLFPSFVKHAKLRELIIVTNMVLVIYVVLAFDIKQLPTLPIIRHIRNHLVKQELLIAVFDIFLNNIKLQLYLFCTNNSTHPFLVSVLELT